jgi:hypothetical protein
VINVTSSSRATDAYASRWRRLGGRVVELTNAFRATKTGVKRFHRASGAVPPLAVCRPGSAGMTLIVRTMYFAYWLMIIGGVLLWIAVGLTVE